MTTRLSNTAYLTVLDPLPLENIGWTVRVLSERDYATQIALIDRFDSMGFTIEVNGTGGGQVVLDADDPIFSAAMPVGETTPIVGQEALWQFYEDGVYRSAILAEDVDEDVVPEGGGLRTTTITGRGIGAVLEWAKVLPAGMPSPTSLTRVLNMNPMAAWTDLFNECQAAGYLPMVSLLFDRYTNSAATSWGAGQRVEVQAGDSMLDLLTRWCEAADLVWTMLPGFRLQVMPASFGRRLEDKVVFTLFRGQVKQGRQRRRRDLATVVYAASGDKGVAISSSGTSQTKWGKRMAWVSAGDSADATGRSAVANASLAMLKDEQVSRSIVVPATEAGRRVFVDYLLNDWIMMEVPEGDSESGARQVRAISVGVDVGGTVGLELTLQSRFQSRIEKLSRRLEALGGSSSSGGAATSKISVSQAITATQLEDLANIDTTGKVAGNVLQWDGAKWVDGSVGGPQAIDWLTDVDTVAVAPTNGQTLVYDSVSGLWKPGTIAGGTGSGTALLPLDIAPVSPHAKDDEFTGTSLNAKWVAACSHANAAATVVVAGDWMTVEPAAAGSASTGKRGGFGIRQVSPTGSFTATAKCVSPRRGDDARSGVFVGSTATGAGHIFGTMPNASRTANADYFTYSDTAEWGGYSSFDSFVAGLWLDVMWFRIRWGAAASTLFFDYSTDGVIWLNLSSRAAQVQPNRMGVAIWANTANTLADHMMGVDWFRVTEP